MDSSVSYPPLSVPPSACLTEVDGLDWMACVGVLAGGHSIGVRTNEPAIASALRTVFRDRLSGPGAAPNMSVWAARATEGPVSPLHIVYAPYSRALRSRSLSRVIEFVWSDMDVRARVADGRVVMLDAVIAVRGGEAVVLPARFRQKLVDDQRRWQQAGFRLLDRRSVEFDVRSGDIIAPEGPGSDALAAWSSELRGIGLLDAPEPTPPSGRFAIRAWVRPHGSGSSLAERVATAASAFVLTSATQSHGFLPGLTLVLRRAQDVVWTTSAEVRATVH